MLNIETDPSAGLILAEPTGPLSKQDFELAAVKVDAFLSEREGPAALLIHTPDFPGWDSFAAMLQHLIFIKDHIQRLTRVALVTDSKVARLAEALAQHFVAARIESFPYSQLERAKRWASGEQPEG